MLAWLAILVFSVGNLGLVAALLWCIRPAIRSGKPTPLSRALRFLYSEYDPRFLWWELMEMTDASCWSAFWPSLSLAHCFS